MNYPVHRPGVGKQFLLNVDVSDQEDADILFREDGDEAATAHTMYTAPPEPSVFTDEDTANEDEGTILDHLNPRQLSAQAEIRYRDERDEELSTFHRLPPSAKKTWAHGNMESSLRQFPDVCNSKYQDLSIVELFELSIENDLVEYLVQESNKHAIFKNNEHPRITKDKLKCFLGILILGGYNSVPHKRLYWEKCKDTRNEYVCNAIRRNRFLHCVDNNVINVNDKLWKIRPLVENIRKKMFTARQQDLSYDESMVKYYGKRSCQQFIRGKPIRFGYNVWCLRLMFLTCHFFFDHLFTGLDLLAFLREQEYGIVPYYIKKHSSEKGEGASMNHQLSKKMWVDNSVVSIASSYLGIQPQSGVKRYSQKEKCMMQVQLPFLFDEYSR
ncbi:hypothetical protein PR048_031452 [Dryococelus australis]|uniref:PiggyBac transposable element-derived protein domain-containing protein n=1 Tax=Dryococelus australis TaxID=614101 RepID=A0ABQ9G5C0_9NEOP|nr:hypothetical protein PR048_031452 [Dryococelus australis]